MTGGKYNTATSTQAKVRNEFGATHYLMPALANGRFMNRLFFSL
jgi:hypothetical protein